MWGSPETPYVQHETDDDGHAEFFYVEVEATPKLFRCDFCGLELRSQEIGEYGITNRQFANRWVVESRDPTDAELSAYYDRY